MGTIRKYKYFILLIIVPVLLLFITNSLINRHNHLVRGYVFSHAHPFKKEPDNQQYPFHSHTDAELVILDLLSGIIHISNDIVFNGVQYIIARDFPCYSVRSPDPFLFTARPTSLYFVICSISVYVKHPLIK